jgi:hypothetical protein
MKAFSIWLFAELKGESLRAFRVRGLEPVPTDVPQVVNALRAQTAPAPLPMNAPTLPPSTVAGIAPSDRSPNERSGEEGSTEADDDAPNVRITVMDAPENATVTVDGAAAVSTTASLPRNRGYHIVKVEAVGFQSREVKINSDKDRSVRMALRPSETAEPAAPAATNPPPGQAKQWVDPFAQ